MKWTGKLAHHDLGTGAWVLTLSGGDRLALYGDVPRELDGKQVVVEGDEMEGMGIGMVADRMVQVRSVKSA